MVVNSLPATNWRSIHKMISWWFSSQGQSSQSIHDEVDPEQLHRKQNKTLKFFNFQLKFCNLY